MKILALLVALVLGLQVSHAQTFDEIFKQKKTQKKYLLQQIAALQVYIGYAQKGYSIARQGITTVKDLAHGELNLHTSYFSSLRTVNPVIKNYAMVADIIAMQRGITMLYKNLLPNLKKSELLNTSEMQLVNSVFQKVTTDCIGLSEDLVEVVTSGKLAMTDDERLSRIKSLYNLMEKNYVFSKDFSNQALTLAGFRKLEKGDAETLTNLYQTN